MGKRATPTSGHSVPDATQEVDISASPLIGEMPTFYLDNFPGLFDQSYSKNAHQSVIDKVTKGKDPVVTASQKQANLNNLARKKDGGLVLPKVLTGRGGRSLQQQQ